MTSTLIGQKIDQTQKFLENGNRTPVTKISIPDNFILQVKNPEKDGYSAVQIGVGTKKKANKAYLGHARKLGIDSAPLKVREVPFGDGESDDEIKPGGKITLDTVFKSGDIVQVTGVSKGKGFAGVVKRHGFAGGPKTHGQSDRHRAPGSIGQGTTPGRVYKGKRMAGRMGSDKVTVRNLVVVDVDSEEKMLYVAGLIPGYKSSWVVVSKTGESKKFVPLLSEKTLKEDEVDEKSEVGENAEMPTATQGASDDEEIRDAKETQPSQEITEGSVASTAAETVKTPDETVSTVNDEVKSLADKSDGETTSVDDKKSVGEKGSKEEVKENA